MRSLVVDDEAAVRESLERSLRFEGYQVVVAADGAEALERDQTDTWQQHRIQEQQAFRRRDEP